MTRVLRPSHNSPFALEAISEIATIPEILWNFAHFTGEKRLTLAQQPHFFRNLPKSPSECGKTFEQEQEKGFRNLDKIYVLVNTPHPVFLKSHLDIHPIYDWDFRVFDNIWIRNNTLVLKGSYVHIFLPFFSCSNS
jgi:hypothetical protein